MTDEIKSMKDILAESDLLLNKLHAQYNHLDESERGLTDVIAKAKESLEILKANKELVNVSIQNMRKVIGHIKDTK